MTVLKSLDLSSALPKSGQDLSEPPLGPREGAAGPIQRLPGLPGLTVLGVPGLLGGRWRVGPGPALPYAGKRRMRHG
jgi:hypothetical protein